jgi:HNH endonuclease
MDAVRKARFEAKFRVTPGCWIWEGCKTHQGYGHFRSGMSKNPMKAHRFSYELYVGPVPEDLIVLHKCDNPSCVNPDHLEVGTWADNAADRNYKGRQAKGEQNGKTKITDSQVREAKELLRQGWMREDVANLFGVSGRTIWYAIKTRKLE